MLADTKMKFSNEDLEKTIENVRVVFENSAVSKRDCLKICLLLEEAMLRCQQHFGSEYKYSLKIQKWFGVPKVIIRIKGEPFDPFYTDDEDEEILSADILKGLMNYEHAETVYAYRNGCNEISTYARKEWKPVKIPGGSITIAALLAVVCAAIHAMLPAGWQTAILQDAVEPLLKTLMGLIVAVTGPFVFLSIVNGICLMEDVATFSSVGLRVIRRFFAVMLLNTKNHILGLTDVSVGSLSASIVHPREVFQTALRYAAAAMILIHNHPSGDPSPSREDINVTQRLVKAGKIMDIPVLDHIILGDNRFVSIKEKGLL